MNKRKIILRIIISPFILPMMLISFNYYAIKRFLLFMWYGGEMMTYEKKFNPDVVRVMLDKLIEKGKQ